MDMNKIGIYIFFLLSILISFVVIVRFIKKDQREKVSLRKYQIVKIEDEILSQIKIETVSKGYVYIKLMDGRQFIIGPSKRLNSPEKLYVWLSTGDSLIKYAYNDTLTLIKQSGGSANFKLLF